MTYTDHKITLDIHKTVAPVSVSVKKGDTGRRLLIHLVERGYPYHISDDCRAVFTAKKPDGNVVVNNCTINDCVITYAFTKQTVSAAGLVYCEIILYGADGKQLTSASFNIIVEDTIYETGTEVESESEYNALTDLIAKVQMVCAEGNMAPAIVCKAEGEVISVSDSCNNTLQGLRIFGKSTQDGTPSPSSPVEIVSLAAPVVSVSDGTNVQKMHITTPDSLPGLPVTSGGNYTDADGQEWICDEVDFTRGVYVQRIGNAVFSGNPADKYTLNTMYGDAVRFDVKGVTTYPRSEIILCTHLPVGSVGSNNAEICNIHGLNGYPILQILSSRLESADAIGLQTYLAENPITIYYVLKDPLETKLTAEEIAAFADLHTYKPNTNIYNDAGAFMAAEYVVDTKIYVDRKCGSAGSSGSTGSSVSIRLVTLLAANWKGSGNLWSQVVTIKDVTEYSQVDLTPSVEQLVVFYEKDLTFVAENEDGVVTVYAIGQKPANDYTIQATITEVIV